jgi:hypothetical protein
MDEVKELHRIEMELVNLCDETIENQTIKEAIIKHFTHLICEARDREYKKYVKNGI